MKREGSEVRRLEMVDVDVDCSGVVRFVEW